MILGVLRGQIKQCSAEIKTLKTQLKFCARDLPAIEERASLHHETITRYAQHIENVENGAEFDEKQAAKIAKDTRNAAITNVVATTLTAGTRGRFAWTTSGNVDILKFGTSIGAIASISN